MSLAKKSPGIARGPLTPKFGGDFRIVNWNTDNSYRNLDKDEEVVEFVLAEAAAFGANVITLQELEVHSFKLLQKRLAEYPGPRKWACFFHWFGLTGHATCVLGHGGSIRIGTLSEGRERYGPSMNWWGYMQITYESVTITNVHTRGHWAEDQVSELHEKVTTGIIAGDFNHTNPQDPGWHQTELANKPTLQDEKIDHVLAIEPPQTFQGDVRDKGGSNHSLVVASIVFPGRATLAQADSLTKKTPE